MKNFSDLSEQELLALAISLEEEDNRIYGEFAHELDEHYPDTAKLFRAMATKKVVTVTASSVCIGSALASIFR
jgi:erythrin-vacuolar iron transport family protein